MVTLWEARVFFWAMWRHPQRAVRAYIVGTVPGLIERMRDSPEITGKEGTTHRESKEALYVWDNVLTPEMKKTVQLELARRREESRRKTV
jgi:hypothetical protein